MPPRKMPSHGTYARYQQGCRCDHCRQANALAMAMFKEARLKKFQANPDMVEHGTLSAYKNYNCRCEPCRLAHVEYWRQYRHGVGRKEQRAL